jgi:hypothetical protein
MQQSSYPGECISLGGTTSNTHVEIAMSDTHIEMAAVAKEKCKPGSANKGAIIFIDELDAVGTKRFDSELSGDR